MMFDTQNLVEARGVVRDGRTAHAAVDDEENLTWDSRGDGIEERYVPAH
jgi:hypothetical protein